MSTNLPEQLVNRFLRSIQHQFYKAPHQKLFFQERNLLLQAICWPARYLDDRAVKISATRYTALLTGIIHTINEHGNLAAVRSPGRYLLKAVQEHMQHHGEDYYQVGKRTRDAIDDIMHGLKPRVEGAEIQSADDSTVPALAETHRILSATMGGRRKTAAPAVQPDLFGNATRMQKPRAIQAAAPKSARTFENSRVSTQKVPKSPAGDSNWRKSLI
ncbi:MAG: hypothetical protein PHQ12_03555 [Chthoniobacteraceae bacterium]|nr:hypothetical protein [Chthoniobacteraceae bacterium]